MKQIFKFFYLLVVLMLVLGLSSCCPKAVTRQAPPAAAAVPSGDLDAQLMQKEKEVQNLQSQVNTLNADLRQKDQALNTYQQQLSDKGVAPQPMPAVDAPLLPPNAKPGECYARVFVDPTYRINTEQVLKKQASEKVDIIPGKYQMVEESLLAKEASERWEVVPAKYKWVEETVTVKEASFRMVMVPAKYEWVEETMLVKPAHTVWKKGRGLIEKIDNSTGEIMCLVEIPAQYRTVKKRVMKAAATSNRVEIPAEYKTVKKRIMVSPPTTRKIEIPAEYKTVKVRKMVSPPEEKRTVIPAEYGTVTKTELVADGHLEWRRVLCETNMGADIIARLQKALVKAGHDPGPIDGVVGSQTMAAVKAFQREKGLAVGNITYETLSRLNVVSSAAM